MLRPLANVVVVAANKVTRVIKKKQNNNTQNNKFFEYRSIRYRTQCDMSARFICSYASLSVVPVYYNISQSLPSNLSDAFLKFFKWATLPATHTHTYTLCSADTTIFKVYQN